MRIDILCLCSMLLNTVSEKVIASQLQRTPTAQERLFQSLLANYSKYSRPVRDLNSALNLSFSFELIKIYEVNAKQQVMSVVSLLRQEWHDESLCWNASEYSGFSSINIPPSKIWIPDVGLYNEKENKDYKKTEIATHVVVDSNGTCRWSFPLFPHVMCSIDVSYFPLDLQECTLRFGSFSYGASEIHITQSGLVRSLKAMYQNGEWKLYDARIKTEHVWDDIRMNNFSVVKVKLSMERNAVYYFIEMLAPCFLISCLTVLGFILPPESGERMSLGMLILLSMTFFQQLTMKMVPLQDFPLISQYFFITVIEIGLALLVTTLTLNFYHHSHSKMPKIMRLIIINFLGKITRIREDKKDATQKRPLKLSERKFQLSLSSKATSETQFDMELTDTASSRGDILETSFTGSTVGLISFKSKQEEEGTPFPSAFHNEASEGNGDTLDNIERHGTKEDGTNEGPSEWNKDWVLASRIVDRFSMYASIVIGILTVLIVFVRAPRFWMDRTGHNG